MFYFMHYGFASVILILGVKMLLSEVYTIPVAVSLALIIDILAICVIVSLLWRRRADLKPLFGRTERLGLIPFRRLLLIENILDLGGLKVHDVMRRLSGAHVSRSWAIDESRRSTPPHAEISIFGASAFFATPMHSWVQQKAVPWELTTRPFAKVQEDLVTIRPPCRGSRSVEG